MSYNLNTINPYHVYVDINVNNANQQNAEPVPLIFNEQRNSPIISNPSDYFFSVVRFSVDTTTLPLLYPAVLLGQSDPNKLVYSFTMTYNYLGTDYTYQQHLIYTPQNNQNTPNPPLVNQDSVGEYYYIYSFNHFINICNQALQSCYNGLNSLVIGAGGTLPSSVAPFLEWDPINCLAIMNADILGYNRTLGQPIRLFMNNSLYNLFSSFEATIEGGTAPNGKNYQLLIYSQNGSNIYTLGGVNYLQMAQEYSTSGLWNPVSSLVFTSGVIPVVPTQTTQPLIFNTLLQNIDGNNANIIPAITDFEVPLEKGTEWKPSVYYSPNSEYRLMDLIGNQPLSNLQLSVYWKDTYANLHLLKLASGSSASIKLLFRRKAFNVAVDRYLSNI
jgi:hypothetical protein